MRKQKTMFDITKLKYKDIIGKTFYVIVGDAADTSSEDEFADYMDFFFTPQNEWTSCETGSTCGESLNNIATFETVDDAKAVVNNLKNNSALLKAKNWDGDELTIETLYIVPYTLTEDRFKEYVADNDDYWEKLFDVIGNEDILVFSYDTDNQIEIDVSDQTNESCNSKYVEAFREACEKLEESYRK